MVGGTVETITQDDNTLRILVWEKQYRKPQYLAIRVQPTDDALLIRPGDSVWWQGDVVLWTPIDKSRQDIQIPRIGYSFTPKGFL